MLLARTGLVLASMALLVSCSSDGDSPTGTPSGPTTTVTETVSASPEPTESSETGTRTAEEADFLARLDGAGEDIPADAEETVLTMGQLVCYSLDQGKDITWSGQKMMKNGFTMDQSGHVIGAAVFALCPEHTDVLQ